VNRVQIAAFAVWLVGCSSQSTPLSVGTNTSWLTVCDKTSDCQGAGSCQCGLCTDNCSSDDECQGGTCGSALASNGQCGAAAKERLCLPKADQPTACTELALADDADLEAAGAVTCDAPGALLCESFDAPLASEYSTWYGDAPIASLQDCLVAKGAGALRYQSAGFDYSQTRMRLASPVSEGPLYARFYAYFPADLTIPEYLALFELWTVDDGPKDKISVDAIGNNQFEINVAGTAAVSAEGVLTRNRWLCIELALDLSPSNGSLSLSIDGETVVEKAGNASFPAAPYSVAVIESVPSEEAQGVELAFDELIVATEPIGCP
jgi:hypothetical protein